MSVRIPFNRPAVTGKEQAYLASAIAGARLSGDGPFTKKCHALLEEQLGVPKVLLTTSCTHALEMSGLLLNVAAGDEVIVPSFTFVSTINAFALRGARPIFVDIRPDTLNIDEKRIEEHITPRTKAILVVHYAGVGCEMDHILGVAGRHAIPVVEDNAHGLFGKYKDRWLGTMGVLGTQSFHETKNLSCGEGGALLVNERSFIERAEIIREKGTDRSRFLRGQVDKYTWVDFGSSYLPSDLLAAFLYAQLEAREAIQERRQRVWRGYHEALQDWARENGATLPTVPPHCTQAFHMYYVVMSTPADRDALIEHLGAQGIQAVFHYQPLHRSRMAKALGAGGGDCPVTDRVSQCLLRLPFYSDLTESDQAQVVSAIEGYSSRRPAGSAFARGRP